MGLGCPISLTSCSPMRSKGFDQLTMFMSAAVTGGYLISVRLLEAFHWLSLVEFRRPSWADSFPVLERA